ncbi:MAG: glutaredoxin [Bacteroidetes bacterium]|nr:glutaredoxin [Bacteroidota bacterium]
MHKKSTHSHEISILYNPECSKAKKAIAYAKTFSGRVLSFEYSKQKRTPTQWREIIGNLGLRPKDLLDKSKEYYQKNIRGREFEEEDWLNVLINNPELIRSPIAIRGNRALMLDNPSDILRL